MLHYRRFYWMLVFGVISCTSVHKVETKSELLAHPVKTRILLIGLDGIGFETFRKLQNGGHFRDFRAPSPMVATFPSISDPNWARILGLPVEESYTKEHFTLSENDGGHITGGI